MATVLMYSSDYCPFCHRAMQLLSRKGAQVEVRSVDGAPAVREEMMRRSGRHTVPQIFIGERHVGGCDDLFELDFDGGLEPLLAAP